MEECSLTPITWPRLAEALAERVATTAAAPRMVARRRRRAPAAATATSPTPWPPELPPSAPRAVGHAAAFWRLPPQRLSTAARTPTPTPALAGHRARCAARWLEPLGPAHGRALPSLRDPGTDRSTRADYVQLPPGGVLVLDGPLLLGQGLPLDLTVHLRLSRAALERRTPREQRWTLPLTTVTRVRRCPKRPLMSWTRRRSPAPRLDGLKHPAPASDSDARGPPPTPPCRERAPPLPSPHHDCRHRAADLDHIPVAAQRYDRCSRAPDAAPNQRSWLTDGPVKGEETARQAARRPRA